MQNGTRPTRHLDGDRWAALLSVALTPFYYFLPWDGIPAARAVFGIPFVFLYAVFLPGFLLAPRIGLRGSDVLEKITTASLAGLAGFMAVAFIWALTGLPLGLMRLALPVLIVLLAGWALARRRAPIERKATVNENPPANAGMAPSDDPPANAGTAPSDDPPANAGMAPSDDPPANAGTALSDDPPRPLERGEKILLVVFSIVLVLVFALVLRIGVPIAFTSDTLDHVAYVAEIAETQELFPTTSFYIDPGSNGADLRKWLLHVFYGFSAAYLHVEALAVLTAMNALLAVLLLLSVYTSGRMLFGSRAVAVLSSVLFLIALDEGLRGTAMRQSFFSHRFGIAFFLAALAYGLRYMEKPERVASSPAAQPPAAQPPAAQPPAAQPPTARSPAARSPATPSPTEPSAAPPSHGLLFPAALLPVALFSFAAIAVHIFFGVILVFAGLTILVWRFCFPKSDTGNHFSRVFPVGLAVAAGVLPFGLYRYLTAFPEANDLHKEIQGVVFLTKNLYIADPYEVFRWFGPVGLLSLVAVPALWKHRKKHAGLGYVFASYFSLLAIVFNPVLLPPIRGAMTYLIARLNVLVPFYFAAAYYLVAFFTQENRELRRKPAAQMLAVLLAGAVVYHIVPVFWTNGFSRSTVATDRNNSYLRWQDALEAVDKVLPEGSVIASDPLTSYSITAFTRHHTVCTFDQHAPPNDVLLEERMQAARDILSPYIPMDRTTALLADHQATHVIVNDRFPGNVRLEYWSMNHEMYPAIRAKFDTYPDTFERVYEREGFVVYRWNGQTTGPDSSFSTPFLVDRLPAALDPLGSQAGEAILEGFYLGDDHLTAGEAVDLQLAWSGREKYPFRNYVVAIRFDHTDPGLPLGGKPFPKIARKIKEKITGRSYRFSEYHKIRSGFLSPDSWPGGKLVLDETSVRVPPNAAPGEYRVTVKLLTLQHQPTYRLKDFFSDGDVYSGVAIARVTIR